MIKHNYVYDNLYDGDMCVFYYELLEAGITDEQEQDDFIYAEFDEENIL